jgi:hypothetical protein
MSRPGARSGLAATAGPPAPHPDAPAILTGRSSWVALSRGAIIASSGNVLAGSPRAREAFVSGLSDALRINAGIALLAAVVAAATRLGQGRRADASLAATAGEPVPAAPSTV